MRVAAAIDLTDRSVDFPWRRRESATLLKSADAEPRDGLSALLFMTIVTARVLQQRASKLPDPSASAPDNQASATAVCDGVKQSARGGVA